MPATLTELLPATKSSPHNALTWTPGDRGPGEGVLTVSTKRAVTTYGVVEFATTWGRGFRLDVARGGTGGEERYDVLVCEAGKGHDRCDCAGFTYRPHQPCKHIAACHALIENGWV